MSHRGCGSQPPHEGHGVSARPSKLPNKPHHGNPEAQALSAALNKLDNLTENIHGHQFFLRDLRRSYIMTLPTAQGWEVLEALKSAGAEHLAK